MTDTHIPPRISLNIYRRKKYLNKCGERKINARILYPNIISVYLAVLQLLKKHKESNTNARQYVYFQTCTQT